MKFFIAGMLSLWASAAIAAEQVQIAPAPAWVKPAEAPKASATNASAPVQMLLLDNQSRYGVDGDEFYSETAARIGSGEGLAAGNLSLSWNPATDTLVVHKVHILRGGQVLDVLGRGQTFTVVRRESNLESAVLDGTLTANIQPEGLQVGDIIDLAVTIRRRDPILRGHSEAFGLIPSGFVIQHARIRAVWPAAKAIHFRETPGLASPVTSKTPDGSELTIDMHDVEMPKPPKFAPTRYAAIGQFEVSDFADWSAISALFSPLFDKAEVLGPQSPLRAEAAKIKAASADPGVRAMTALRLVQDQVRYVALALNGGGYTPASADLTWSRRFGDCKGKTALLLALLHELGIKAEPVLVSTILGDGLDARLPIVQLFNHVLIRAVIGGQVYWLDGTRIGDRDLARLPVPNYHWGLPVRASGAKLEPLTVPPLKVPAEETALSLDASAGLDAPAPAHAETMLRGDAALQLKVVLASASKNDVDTNLRDFWRNKYDWIDVKAVNFGFDEAKGEMRLSMDGSAKMNWYDPAGGTSRQYETDGTTLGWKANLSRDPGPFRDAPYAVDYPSFTRSTETIRLPLNGKGFSLVGTDIDQTAAGIKFHRAARIQNGVFTAEASTDALQPEFPASQAEAAASALTKLSENTLYIRAPVSYTPTDKDLATLEAKPPTTSDDYLNRGLAFEQRKEHERAIAEFSEAIKLDPKSAYAYANLGTTLIASGHWEGAEPDIHKALELEPDNYVALHGKGLLELHGHDYEAARKTFSRNLELKPQDLFALNQRASAEELLKDYDAAIRDLNQAAEIAPQNASVFVSRAVVYQQKGDLKSAEADIDRAIALDEGNIGLFRFQGMIYLTEKRYADAVKSLTKILRLHPTDKPALAMRAEAYNALRDSADADKDMALLFKDDPRAKSLAECRQDKSTKCSFSVTVTTWRTAPSSWPPHDQVSAPRPSWRRRGRRPPGAR